MRRERKDVRPYLGDFVVERAGVLVNHGCGSRGWRSARLPCFERDCNPWNQPLRGRPWMRPLIARAPIRVLWSESRVSRLIHPLLGILLAGSFRAQRWCVCLPKFVFLMNVSTATVAVFLVFRFLSGFAGAAFLSVAGGSVSDLFTNEKVAT